MRYSLRNKIFLTLMMVVLLPTLGYYAYTLATLRHTSRENVTTNMLYRLDVEQSQLELLLEQVYNQVSFVRHLCQLNTVVSMMAHGEPTENEPAHQRLETMFQHFGHSLTTYQRLSLFQTDGTEVIRVFRQDSTVQLAPSDALTNVADERYFQVATGLPSGTIHIDTLLNAGFDGAHIIRYTTALYAPDGLLGGVLVIDVDVADLISKTHTTGSDSYLMTPNHDLIAASGDLYNTGVLTTVTGRYVEGTDDVVFNHEDRLIGVANVQPANHDVRWLLVIQDVIPPWTQHQQAHLQEIGLLAAGSLALVLAATAYFSFSVVRPVNRLMTAMDACRRGKWDPGRHITDYVQSRDEIGQLATHFQRMVDETAQAHEQMEFRVVERTQALEQANHRLREVDERKSAFLEDIAHEIRTPISVISLHLQLLRRRPERLNDYIERIDAAIARLIELGHNVQDISELDSARPPERDQVDLNAIVSEIYTMHEPYAERKQLEMILELQDGLSVFQAMRGHINQVVDNLLNNAIKYTEEGGRVTVQTYATRQGIHLAVQDSGIGISESEIPRIFDRFYRADAVRQSTMPGTGLGLAIVKEIIDRHGGTITVNSSLGAGTTFDVYLPFDAPDQE